MQLVEQRGFPEAVSILKKKAGSRVLTKLPTATACRRRRNGPGRRGSRTQAKYSSSPGAGRCRRGKTAAILPTARPRPCSAGSSPTTMTATPPARRWAASRPTTRACSTWAANVAEWVNDFYDVVISAGGKAEVDPMGPASGEFPRHARLKLGPRRGHRTAPVIPRLRQQGQGRRGFQDRSLCGLMNIRLKYIEADYGSQS